MNKSEIAEDNFNDVPQYEAEALEDAAEAAEASEAIAADLAQAPDDLVQPEYNEALAESVWAEEVQSRCLFVATNQASVNEAMAGLDWLEKAGLHEDVDYAMAALDECQELWTCALNFKWWDRRSFKPDLKNARMELVDILHFITSEELISSTPSLAAKGMKEGVEAAMFSGVGFKGHLKSFIASLAQNSVSWSDFWGMVVCLDEDSQSNPKAAIDHILNLYTAKATLNKFRTRYRNSEAGYRKVWVDGREDNDIMMSWLEEIGEFPGVAALDRWLEESYSRIISLGK